MRSFLRVLVYVTVYSLGFYLLDLDTVKEKVIFVALVVVAIICTVVIKDKE